MVVARQNRHCNWSYPPVPRCRPFPDELAYRIGFQRRVALPPWVEGNMKGRDSINDAKALGNAQIQPAWRATAIQFATISRARWSRSIRNQNTGEGFRLPLSHW